MPSRLRASLTVLLLVRGSAAATPTPEETRAAAFSERDSGNDFFSEAGAGDAPDADYAEALAVQWGGPETPRWYAAAMRQYPRDHGEAQRGRRALVTGASSGVGFFVAKLLAAVGLVVVLPARPNLEFEAHGAAAAIRAAVPGATIEVPEVPLDLRSFASVRAFGAHLRERGGAIDVLCLNAARGGGPRDTRETTTEGHEVVMAVNLLSHALLVHELLPALRASAYARIVAHTDTARANAPQSSLSDLESKRSSPWSQYALSKAGLCLLARALNARLRKAGVAGAAVVADPGLAATGLSHQNDLANTLGLFRRGFSDTRAFLSAHAAHAADAALPVAMACLAGEPGDFWTGELVGPKATSLDAATHIAGHLLWQPLRPNDPFGWPDQAADTLWQSVGAILGGGYKELAAAARAKPKDEL